MGDAKQTTVLDQNMSEAEFHAEILWALRAGLTLMEFANQGTKEDWEAIFVVRQILAMAEKRFALDALIYTT